MNQHSRSSFTLTRLARVGFISQFGIALVICLLSGATQVKAQQPNWSATGSLATGRFGHTSTLLINGKVLVVGGRLCNSNTSCTEFSSAELYDPATGAWSPTGNLSVPRHAHVAVRLSNGKVLVAGGHNGATNWSGAELYDPDTGIWSATGNLTAARAFATATLLANGKVLVAGGGAGNTFLSSAELYDPDTGAWSSAGTMNVPRGFHTATLLADGRVLVASGASLTTGALTLRRTAELYDPANGSWTSTGSLATARVFHTETRLANGKVLVTGGSDFNSAIYDTSELYEPATGLWSAAGRLTTARISHTATLLSNGKVLAVAGFNNEPVNSTQRSAELFNPATETWTATTELNVVRGNHAATLLADGRVLVTGGNGGGSPALTNSELFDSTTAPPLITGASVSGKKLFVAGQAFDDGADVFLNDEKQKTANEEGNATTLLRCKKAGKNIARGETVRVKVRNSDGTESAEFSYTRPVE
jgi:large repetitive protein